MELLDKEFWDKKYENGYTGWDIGYPSPPIINYFKAGTNKSKSILIPGAGNGYEAEHLCQEGYNDITVIDISSYAINNLRKKIEGKCAIELIEDDFFNHNEKYDIIVEQTFFCALMPDLREEYVHHMHHLLKDNGIILGVLFNTLFQKQGPPFGGTEDEYRNLFESHFVVRKMEGCYNSIPPRMGNELFVIFTKKML